MITKNELIKSESNYFGFIDILRLITILISFLHHSNVIYFLFGHTFFFVLSGFILTHQATLEYNKSNQFSWFNFTMRRILRIFPLYFLIILFTYFILPHLTSNEITLAPIGYYLSFTSNYYLEPHVFILIILWSVAVQEQFYFFISFCFKFFHRYLFHVAFIMIISSVIYKAIAEYYDLNVYPHTLNHFSSFGIGIIFALLYRKGYKINTKKISFIIIFFLAVLSLFFISNLYIFRIWYVLDNFIVALVFSYFILFATSIELKTNRFMKILQKMGQFSYGMYCFQGLIITFGNFYLLNYFHSISSLLIVFINLILLVTSAYLSYILIEKPILNFKKFFRT